MFSKYTTKEVDSKLNDLTRMDIISSNKFIEMRVIITIYIALSFLYIAVSQYWLHHCEKVVCVDTACVCYEAK